MEVKAWPIALAALCALLGAMDQLLFKLGSSAVGLNPWTWITNGRIIGGMTLYGFSAVLFITALRNTHLSLLYPVIATGYVWGTLFSKYVLGEQVSTLSWTDVTLIMAGVTLVAGG